jgi:DNA-binding transcriptional LysR family regulator
LTVNICNLRELNAHRLADIDLSKNPWRLDGLLSKFDRMRGREHSELRAFVEVAKAASFARAAEQLNVTTSALSQSIRNLEQHLGARLLNRTTRSVALTDAGTQLLSQIRPAFATLDDAVAAVKTLGQRPSGPLRINSSRIAAIHYLAPLIGPFLDAHPEIKLDLVLDDALVDIVGGGFDAGVRIGERLERDMVAIRLSGDIEMLVVASPGYIQSHGYPTTPRELDQHRCVNFRLSNGAPYRWEFERSGEKLDVAVDGPLLVNDLQVAILAARDGVGLIYLFKDMIRDELATGALVQVLADWTPPFPGFYLYHPSGRQVVPALRAFLDFMARRRVR